MLRSYQESPQFTDLADRTRIDYIRLIKKIEARYSDFPIDALEDKRTRNEFMVWRDQLAIKSRRQADYTLAVLALILAWAVDRGIVTSNPCTRPRKVYRSKRVERVWSAEQEIAFLNTAPEHLCLAYMLAVWTGQRQGDLIRLTWSAYDGEYIRLRQRKTGKHVTIPVGEPLQLVLDQTKRTTLIILSTTRNAPWTESGFRASWRTARKRAEVEGVTFHDLRGTAATRLGKAGCSLPEIATVTGLSLRDVGLIVDTHHLKRDLSLGISAIRKRELYEKRTKIPN